jgi:hypothetical protein
MAGRPFTPVEHARRARRQGLRAGAALAAFGGAWRVAVVAFDSQGLSYLLHGAMSYHAAACAFQ